MELVYSEKAYYRVETFTKIEEFFALFVAPKLKFCSTKKYDIIEEHETIKCFRSVSENLNAKEYFEMIDCDKLIAKVPLSCKKGFDCGVVVPH